jgi:hypothetical protein
MSCFACTCAERFACCILPSFRGGRRLSCVSASVRTDLFDECVRAQAHLYCVTPSIYFRTLPLTRTWALFALTISRLAPRDSSTNAPWTLEMGPMGCPETSERNYHNSLRNNPETRSSHVLRGGSLKSTGNVTARWQLRCAAGCKHRALYFLVRNGRKVLGGGRNVLIDQIMWKNRGSVRHFLFWTHDITYWTPVLSPICGQILYLFFKNCVTWHCANAYAFVGFFVQSFTAVQYNGDYASQSQWPHNLRRGSAAARFPGLRGRIPPVHTCLLWVLCAVR